MIIDKELELSLAQAITTSDASTNYVDLGAARDLGVSDGIYVAFTVTANVSATGAATVTFSVEGDDNTSFSTAATITASAAIGKATLVAGHQFFLKIPVGFKERYLRAYYTVGTGPLTAGAFSAQIVQNIQKNIQYPNAL